MGSSPQSPQPQQVTTTTSNLPEYARPYFENLMGRAEGALNTQYQGYSGDRIAGFTPEQLKLQQNVLGLGASQQVGMGSAITQQAGLGALSAGQSFTPGEFTVSQVSPTSRYAPQLNTYQMEAPRSFGESGAADYYMSPFMQSALDVQRRQAVGSAKQTQLASDLGAARQGTYGGSRQLMAALERERQLGRQLGDIEATGTQQAFQQAQQQFNTEQQARQVQQQANLQSAMGTQQLGAQVGMQGAQQGMQAELANQQQLLEAQRMAEQTSQFGAGQGLQGYQVAGQIGQTMGNLGQYQQQMDLSRLQAQMSAAAQQQQMQQQKLDVNYADFLRQRDYPMEQLGYFSNILRGLPIGLSSTQTAYAPPPSMLSQVAGAGLGGLGMYNLMK
jgi:hypothetical protein